MKRYFVNCKTLEEVKHLFKELAKKLHPDCGGDAEEFKAMKAEYEKAFERCKNTHQKDDGTFYQKETNESASMYADIIDKIITFKGVLIEIIGSWIWVSGNTKPYKDQLKEIGFKWSKSKSAWYYTGQTVFVKRKGGYSMNSIRNMWGSTVVDAENREAVYKQIATTG